MKKGRGWNLLYPLTIIIIVILVHIANQTVSVFSESAPIKRNHCIIIDPGHGGVDGGAISCTGLPESQYNLEISLRLRDLLQLLGFETLMIREQDISIYTKGETIAQKKISDLKERVRIINETENALLLSIHQNHYSDPRYCGAQVFYSSVSNSSILAEQLQTSFKAHLDANNHRHSKQCKGVYVMDHIRCTGVLIECGFLSNTQEEAKLRSSDYQKKLCSVIAATTIRFLSNT